MPIGQVKTKTTITIFKESKLYENFSRRSTVKAKNTNKTFEGNPSNGKEIKVI